MRMGRRIATTLKRAAIHAGPTVLGIIVLDFLLPAAHAGRCRRRDGDGSRARPPTESMAALRHQFGLDQPLLTQL